jgi:hypothetical protein
MEKLKALVSIFWQNSFGKRGNLKKLWSETAILIKNDLSSDLCKELRRKIDAIIVGDNQRKVWVDLEGADKRIFEFEIGNEEVIAELKIKKRIQDIQKYSGKRVAAWLLMANKISETENNRGSGGGWHKDSAFSHQVKYIWYLSKVKENSGPFQYVKGTNRVEKYLGNELSATRFEKVEGNIETVTGDEGDLLICDTLCIHRGKPVESGDRYAITLYTFHNKKAKQKMLNEIYTA